MSSVEWRSIPTVLYPQEILDKAFSRASNQAELVEDPDKYHRVRKQMTRMVQSASDVIAKTLNSYVDRWPSLNALSEFDRALVDAAVGCDKYRKNLGGWSSDLYLELLDSLKVFREISGRVFCDYAAFVNYQNSIAQHTDFG